MDETISLQLFSRQTRFSLLSAKYSSSNVRIWTSADIIIHLDTPDGLLHVFVEFSFHVHFGAGQTKLLGCCLCLLLRGCCCNKHMSESGWDISGFWIWSNSREVSACPSTLHHQFKGTVRNIGLHLIPVCFLLVSCDVGAKSQWHN